mgnify:CR=1 FL=1
MQGNVMVEEQIVFSKQSIYANNDDAEDFMFYLDFYHDCYSISESAMFKFNLQETKFHSLQEMFQSFLYEDDLQYVLQAIRQLQTGCIRKKNIKCRCYSIHHELLSINLHCEVIKNRWEQWSVVVGSITELTDDSFGKTRRLKNESQFIADFSSMSNSKIHTSGYVMKIGIDNIKEINEKHGLHIAENILQCTLGCILQNIDKDVQVYRKGSEKFILFDKSGAGLKDAERIYRKIKNKINKCNEQMEYQVFYTISAGVADFDSYIDNYIELCKKVDFAFNAATRRGRNDVFLFEQDKYEEYIRKLDIEEKLRRDVRDGFRGFEVFYQPIVDVNSEQVTGAEALLRWHCEEYGSLSPSVFIPILEESGLIIPVGRWVMKSALKQCKDWQEQIPGFRMNINVSYIQLKKSDVAYDVLHDLKELELDSKYVLFELTESGFVETDFSFRHIIKSLQKQKIKLGLDDFGTGYSNLCYLNDLKVYIIKIDRTFAMKALKSSYHYKLLKHIIDMAHSINLKVCIEGVEEENELEVIRELLPDYIQGYYFGRPVCKDDFREKHIV